MNDKLPHCSPRGWTAIPSAPPLSRLFGDDGDRAAAPSGWLRDRLECPLPGNAIAHDCVADRQQLAGDCDDGDLLGLAGREEAFEEGLEHGVVLACHYGPHKQCPPHTRPAAADEALPPPL